VKRFRIEEDEESSDEDIYPSLRIKGQMKEEREDESQLARPMPEWTSKTPSKKASPSNDDVEMNIEDYKKHL
jgi:hypothetical protein